MMKYGGIMDQKLNNVNRFWRLYRDAVIGSGIPEKNADWYVRRGQKFTVSTKGKRLRCRSDVDWGRCELGQAMV